MKWIQHSKDYIWNCSDIKKCFDKWYKYYKSMFGKSHCIGEMDMLKTLGSHLFTITIIMSLQKTIYKLWMEASLEPL